MQRSSVSPISAVSSYQRPVTDLIRRARRGVLRHRVDEIAQLIGLTDKEMAYILNMSVRNLHGKAITELLTLAASERLLLLERLIEHGIGVFDGRVDLFSRWLHTPLNELGYREIPQAEQPVSIREMGSFQEPKPTRQPPATESVNAIIAQSPLAVLDTVSGFSLAEDVLGRIEWGIVG